MIDSISLLPARNITEIKYFIDHEERKSVFLIITKPNTQIILFGTKYEFFLPPYQLTFSLLV